MIDKVVKLLKLSHAMIKRFCLLPQAKAKYKGKHIWLVCERGNDARDNGLHMFRYLRKSHQEIDAYYIITPDSADLDKIKDLGNIVYSGTREHWMLYIIAEKILTAFEPHFCPSDSYSFFKYMRRKNNQKIVFLQHGVIGNDLPLYHQQRAGFDLFICGAKPEYDFISSTFGYHNNEVRYTGLARFDALAGLKTKRQLLIMPTYRKWLRDQAREEVKESLYVKRWQSLLSNPKLAAMTQEYDIDVIFYPHQLMQKYVSMFSSESKRIIIADYKHYDVQPLLKESCLLVTDYSSIQFDFAYMTKPLMYYQFDEKEAFEKQFGHGYFDYRKNGFGEVVTQEDELIGLIDGYLKEDCTLKPLYKDRIEGFFPLHDNHNCERIYKEIMSLEG